MTPNPSSRRTVVRRRQAQPLPKRRYHLLLALLLLSVLIAAPFLWSLLFASDDAATPVGAVEVAGLSEEDRLAVLDKAEGVLPDLLQDSVPEGTNPTERARNTEPKRDPAPKRVEIPTASPLSPIDPSLMRETPSGLVPGPNADGLTPLVAYAAPVERPISGKPVSLIIGGLGINRTMTQRAIDELPPSVTLSFAAHAQGLQAWIDLARDNGHEVLLEIPMEGETFDPSEPGALQTLRADVGLAVNRRNLHTLLSRAQGYIGIINYRGEVLAQRSDAMGAILTEVDKSGLALFVDGSFEAPALSSLSASAGLPYVSGFGIIDPVADADRISTRLKDLSNRAKSDRHSFGVGFAYPQTIDAVKIWSATLADDGLQLVPVSALLS